LSAAPWFGGRYWVPTTGLREPLMVSVGLADKPRVCAVGSLRQLSSRLSKERRPVCGSAINTIVLNFPVVDGGVWGLRARFSLPFAKSSGKSTWKSSSAPISQRACGLAQAMDCRTHHRVAQPLPPLGQGSGVPQPVLV